jgi:hypothetical protein
MTSFFGLWILHFRVSFWVARRENRSASAYLSRLLHAHPPVRLTPALSLSLIYSAKSQLQTCIPWRQLLFHDLTFLLFALPASFPLYFTKAQHSEHCFLPRRSMLHNPLDVHCRPIKTPNSLRPRSSSASSTKLHLCDGKTKVCFPHLQREVCACSQLSIHSFFNRL